MKRRFRIEMHEEYGTVGLKPLWMPDHQADPLTGMGVAHDVLEHGSHDVCEWQGLGGAIWVRVDNGYFGRTRGNPDPIANIASDFYQLYGLWEGADLPDPKRLPHIGQNDRNPAYMIEEIVDRGCDDTIREDIHHNDSIEREQAVMSWTRPEQRARMRAWMLLGYRACAHRWRLADQYTLGETFRAIESKVDAFLAEYAHAEGVEVTLTFDVRCNVRLTLHDYDYED